MVAAAPVMKAPANFNKAASAATPAKPASEPSTAEVVAGVSLASIFVMIATEFVTNAFFHYSPLGLALSAKFASFAGFVPSAAAMGASSAVTGGGEAGLTFN